MDKKHSSAIASIEWMKERTDLSKVKEGLDNALSIIKEKGSTLFDETITVWKDGTWKCWRNLDATYVTDDPNWLVNIPLPK